MKKKIVIPVALAFLIASALPLEVSGAIFVILFFIIVFSTDELRWREFFQRQGDRHLAQEERRSARRRAITRRRQLFDPNFVTGAAE